MMKLLVLCLLGVVLVNGCMHTTIPSNHLYYMTSFCDKETACGPSCGDCNSWYSADSQRFGCGALLRCTARGKSAHLRVIDAGPACFVEDNAGRAIIDASPLACDHFFGSRSCGWSDKFSIECVRGNATTDSMPNIPLGPCAMSAKEAKLMNLPPCWDAQM